MWSLTEPHQHVFSQTMWPRAGVGGHNFCRNPDRSEDSPWCALVASSRSPIVAQSPGAALLRALTDVLTRSLT